MLKENLKEKKVLRDEHEYMECDHCKLIFDKMLDGFALHEIVFDKNKKAYDYRFLKVNPAFEKMTGLKGKDVIGKTILEILPETEKNWISDYEKVALNGKSMRFERYAKSFNKYFEVVAFSPKKGQFATIFTDITKKRETEEEVKKALDKANKMLELMTERELKMVQLKDENAELRRKLESLKKK